MSQISNRHSIVAFDSKISKAFEGQRLAKIGYKTTKTGKTSVCVSVPRIGSLDIATLKAFEPHLLSLIEQTQDAIIRNLYESGANEVSTEQLSIESVAAFLDSDSRGERLTKEMIGEWFQENLADSLMVAFAEKLGISEPTVEDDARIGKVVETYKEKFASLSGSKTLYTVEIVEKLEKALSLVETEDLIGLKLAKKLATMKSTPKTADMLGL